MTILVSDSFDRANNPTSLGTADTGQVWDQVSGNWGIDTNAALVTWDFGDPGTSIAVVESTAVNGVTKITLPSVDLPNFAAGIGIIFRYVDTSFYWRLLTYDFPGAHGQVRLQRVYSGSATTVIDIDPPVIADGDTLSVAYCGAQFEIFINDVSVGTYDDTGNPQNYGTKCGLVSVAGTTFFLYTERFDNFLVTTNDDCTVVSQCTPPPVAIPVLDLEADAGLGLANNDPVALWADQSGSGNDAIQSTGANQPTFKSADGPGGRPCITFDGTNDYLVLPDIASQKFTIVAVFKPADSALRSVLCGAAGSLQYRSDNSLKQNILRCGELNIGESTTALSTSVFQQTNVRWDGASALFRLSSAADGMVTNASALHAPINRIGINGANLGEFFGGSICAIRVYLGVLALDQVQAIEAELLARWGV